MTTKKMINEYDEIKGLLGKIRKIQLMAAVNKGQELLKEQITNDGESEDPNREAILAEPQINNKKPAESGKEQEDIAVINSVEVEIHSEDPEDLTLEDDEKKKISQLIDDFRGDVSEIAEFDKMHIYPDSAKLDGRISSINMAFTLSTGDDTGLYVSNPSLLKIDDNSLSVINKLKTFLPKFSNTINDLLLNRSTN